MRFEEKDQSHPVRIATRKVRFSGLWSSISGRGGADARRRLSIATLRQARAVTPMIVRTQPKPDPAP